MANTLYNIARKGFLTEITVGAFTGQLDWEDGSSDFVAVLIDADEYTFNETHTSMDDVSGSAIVAKKIMTSRGSLADGTATADNTVFEAVSAGPAAEAVLIYRSNDATGTDFEHEVDTACVLVAYLDTGISGLPVTPNGGDITVLWNGGNGWIFRL